MGGCDSRYDEPFVAESASDIHPLRKEPYAKKIERHCDEIRALLLAKNQAYSGGQVFTKQRVFSKASSVERILTRLDDKLSRFAELGPTEENVQDMIGYLVLLRIERELENWK